MEDKGYFQSKVESYSFGKVFVNGETYTKDLIIYPDKISPNWWRKEGHLLQIDDLKEVVKYKPDVLIIGTGYNGVMSVPRETVEQLRQIGIEVVVKRTQEAVEIFNKSDKTKRVVAALHLTC